jgi:hypothetical protein
MARLFIDGFNSGDASAWDTRAATNFPANRAGFGPYCAYSDATGRYLQKNFGTKTELYGKCRWEPTSSYSGATLMSFQFLSGGSIIAGIHVSTLPYAPRFYTGTAEGASSNTLRATADVSVVVGRVYLLEFYIKPKTDGTGRFTLKLDGITVIDWTGVTSGGAESVDSFRVFPTTTNYATFYVGDVVLDDSAWIGNTRIGYKLVNGAGEYTEMTPSGAASNFQNVDEVPPSALDFNWSNTDEQKDMYTLDTLQVGTGAFSVNSIKSVQVQATAKYAGSPTPTVLKTGVRIGSTDDWKGTATPGVSSGPVSNIWETNPATSNPWATTDDFQAGVKVT